MTVAQSIATVLQRVGRPMTLRRVGTPNIDVTVYGAPNGYVPGELVGEVIQGATLVIFSDLPLQAASWPGPLRPNDKLIMDGVPRNVVADEPKYLGTDILAHFCQVKG